MGVQHGLNNTSVAWMAMVRGYQQAQCVRFVGGVGQWGLAGPTSWVCSPIPIASLISEKDKKRGRTKK